MPEKQDFTPNQDVEDGHGRRGRNLVRIQRKIAEEGSPMDRFMAEAGVMRPRQAQIAEDMASAEMATGQKQEIPPEVFAHPRPAAETQPEQKLL